MEFINDKSILIQIREISNYYVALTLRILKCEADGEYKLNYKKEWYSPRIFEPFLRQQ